MKLIELHQGTKKAFTPIIVRKSVLAFCTMAVLVGGILGHFYFHLLRKTSLASLISAGTCILVLVLGFVALILKRKDDYKSFIACMLQFKGSISETECKKVIEAFLNPSQGGFAGFKSAVRDNKILLSAMLTGCKAIPAYADRGFLTVLLGIFLRFVYAPFKYFAILDGLLVGGGRPNRIYRVMASTRWFPIRNKYSKSVFGYVLANIIPIIAWIILSAVVTLVLNSYLGITPAIETMIWFGFLSLMLQLRNFGGNRGLMHRMALNIYNKEENMIPAADYNLCLAFAQISQIYYQACMEAGYIQTTSPQGTQSQELSDGNNKQLLQ